MVVLGRRHVDGTRGPCVLRSGGVYGKLESGGVLMRITKETYLTGDQFRRQVERFENSLWGTGGRL